MKRILTLSFAALLLAGSAIAQDTKQAGKEKAGKEWKKHGKHGKHGKHHARKHDGMAKELNLSEAQKQEFKTLNQEYKTKAKALRAERKARAENILTAEQKSKVAALREKRKTEARQKGGDRFEKAKKELNLTEAQGQRMKAINESFRERAKAIRGNESLSKEQKKEQFKSLNEQRRNEMKAVLTAEQIQKLESRKKEFKGRKDKKAAK